MPDFVDLEDFAFALEQNGQGGEMLSFEPSEEE
ncbi:uncharacterized protein NMK_1822 [Novimethylophilus kurashikiensis]|uniref:Uncharacterized protein n=1 Tax=Novimethylophilus kurashikiensis TaxID=1825523 RepID=A0A2R5F7T8_9PROT|nr:uncharacterized protein NMK_1822 [Novimethylophilus kurashikiensis]